MRIPPLDRYLWYTKKDVEERRKRLEKKKKNEKRDIFFSRGDKFYDIKMSRLLLFNIYIGDG